MMAPLTLQEKLRAPRVVWRPQPGPNGRPGSQQLALSCQCNEILYHGTRGPGKTDTQIMDFVRLVGKGYGQHWRGILMDRKYKNLDDIISKTKRWLPQLAGGARFISSGQLKWTWPTGEELLLRHMNAEDDYWNYHGQEFPWMGWNELTKYPTSNLYDMMMSCNRTSFVPVLHSTLLTEEDRELLEDYNHDLEALTLMEDPTVVQRIKSRIPPEIVLRVFSTTNPFGPGHAWVKSEFIDKAKPGQVFRNTRVVFDPREQREREITKTRVHLFGSYKENRFLPAEYVLELNSITDPTKREAWLKGNWDIAAGGALEGVWNPDVQVLPRFALPEGWSMREDRSHDWGSSRPFANVWFAKANGEDITLPDGTKRSIPRNSLVIFHEWYGTDKIGTNTGLRMPAREVAEGVKAKEKLLLMQGWIRRQPKPGPADSSIYDVQEAESLTIAKLMEKEGVHWVRAEKGPGSRKIGLELLRNALHNSTRGDRPGLFIMDHCKATLQILPNLPRDEDDPDDVDTEAEDHLYDAIRYRILHEAKDFITDTKHISLFNH